jgi:ribosome-associated heat shock protein Hsp15
MEESGIRIDKWLWAVRLFKTRSQATEACKTSRVTMDDMAVKPSREIHVGDEIRIRLDPLVRTVQVKALLKNRVGAKLVENYMEDRTPQEEYDRVKLMREVNFERRDRGIGRPTKKERRLIEKLKKSKF